MNISVAARKLLKPLRQLRHGDKAVHFLISRGFHKPDMRFELVEILYVYVRDWNAGQTSPEYVLLCTIMGKLQYRCRTEPDGRAEWDQETYNELEDVLLNGTTY